MAIPQRNSMKTLSNLDKSRIYYILDSTVCEDIRSGRTDGRFGEFFKRAASKKPISFLIPDSIKNEFGGYVYHNADEGRQGLQRVIKYLKEYGKCESKYWYEPKHTLYVALNALRKHYPDLSETDAYLLYLFKTYAKRTDLRLLTSDGPLRKAALAKCPGHTVIDPRRFGGAYTGTRK